MEHNEKVVDGVVLKYLCQPCPECKARLEVAEEMAILLKSLGVVMAIQRQTRVDRGLHKEREWDGPIEETQRALSAWEKAGKGGI